MENKIAAVTGAGAGIGKAITLSLAKAGAKVLVSDIVLEAAQSVAEEVKALGGEALAIKLDVTKKADIDQAVEKVIAQWGRIDIWCNNAGVSSMNAFTELSEQDWDHNMDINAKGTFLCAQAAAKQMKSQTPHASNGLRGKIINIASTAGRMGNVPFLSHYIASKYAVVGLTQAIACEMSPHGITVNSVCPGYVSTSMQERELNWEAKLRDLTVEEVKKLYIEDTPLARLETPQDVAGVVMFLASKAADFITGAAIVVNGGAYMD